MVSELGLVGSLILAFSMEAESDATVGPTAVAWVLHFRNCIPINGGLVEVLMVRVVIAPRFRLTHLWVVTFVCLLLLLLKQDLLHHTERRPQKR